MADQPETVNVPLPHAYLAKAAREAARAQVDEWMALVFAKQNLLPLSAEQYMVVNSTAAYAGMVTAIWMAQAILITPELAQILSTMTAEEMQYALMADCQRCERLAKEAKEKKA